EVPRRDVTGERCREPVSVDQRRTPGGECLIHEPLEVASVEGYGIHPVDVDTPRWNRADTTRHLHLQDSSRSRTVVVPHLHDPTIDPAVQETQLGAPAEPQYLLYGPENEGAREPIRAWLDHL